MVQHITRGNMVAHRADRPVEALPRLQVVSSLLQPAEMAEVQFEFLQVSQVLLD
jgi:hypothetical protein